MNIEIAISTRTQHLEISDKNLIGILKPNNVQVTMKGKDAVRHALLHPIGSKRLCDIVKPGEKIAVITSDLTRPLPSYTILPLLLDELTAAGVADDDITIVFALGSHRHQTDAERKHLVGEDIFNKYNCVDSNIDDAIHLGITSSGTPVDITRVVAEADRRICIGNIEYHYFAGYSGGAKAILPGCSTRMAIQCNHSKMVYPQAEAGNLKGNPVREDIEDAIRYCFIDFILNVVIDEHKNIIYAVAGDYIKAHREGCRFLDLFNRTTIAEQADIVITSPGEAPKDINLYQTQKALDNAKKAIKPGGIIILVGSCKEGYGESVFEQWLKAANSPQDLIDRIQIEFRLGGHKAAAIALALKRCSDVYLVSDMPEDFAHSVFMKPFTSVQEAYEAALAEKGANASVYVMPYGSSTLPYFED